jgi:TolB-like protein/tetratricopeptide (TPR) repeat protein
VTENTKTHPITIDLNQFKLHIDLKKKIELTLYFNSPSRRFYLSLIAFVVNEMKRQGKLTSIPLEGHHDLLALLNDTVGGSAGSSDKENLLPRIYRKWKDALPNLEEAPLFKVLGKKKEYDEGTSRTYSFTEDEKDRWANLFEYKGSHENVRLKFAIDKIGAGLDDVVILYEDSLNGDAWERFISNLKSSRKEESTPETKVPEPILVPFSSPQEPRTSRLFGYYWVILAAVMVVIAAVLIWRLYTPTAPQTEVIPKEKIVASQPEKALAPAAPSPEVVSKEEGGPKLEVASKGKMAFPLSDKPSIAVLPFVNMSKDPEQEFFSDGLTEEIITALSKSPYLFVVARTSTLAYKGKSIPVDQVAQELRVRYILEGSVRRAGDQVRISAQLIDGKTGHHQWAERYDGNMRDVFAIQDEIASKIMKTLQVKLRVGPSPAETRGGSKNAEAYLKSVEANQQLLRCTEEGTAQAQRLFEEVIALEPDFSRGYSGLAICYAIEANARGRGSAFYNEQRARAIDLAQKALSLNETDAINHAVLAYLFVLTKQHDKAVVRADRALALDANSFLVLEFSACALMYSCKGKEALAALEKAERLNPSYPFIPVHLCWVYLLLGRYEEAFEQAQKAVERNRQSASGQFVAQLLLTVTCNLTGREAEARAAARKFIDIYPNFSVERWRSNLAFKDNDQIDLAMSAWRKAGLK